MYVVEPQSHEIRRLRASYILQHKRCRGRTYEYCDVIRLTKARPLSYHPE
jgi:hypothetical protein